MSDDAIERLQALGFEEADDGYELAVGDEGAHVRLESSESGDTIDQGAVRMFVMDENDEEALSLDFKKLEHFLIASEGGEE